LRSSGVDDAQRKDAMRFRHRRFRTAIAMACRRAILCNVLPHAGVRTSILPDVSTSRRAPRLECLPSGNCIDFVVIITNGGAVFAQGAGAFVKSGVVGQQRAAFAAGAEVFAWIKAEAGNVAECADGLALYFAPCACAASSTSGNLCFLQIARIGLRSNGWP